jgi:hypothetical protein
MLKVLGHTTVPVSMSVVLNVRKVRCLVPHYLGNAKPFVIR